MRCGAWRVHANVCAVSVLGHTTGASDANRPGLCARWERLRMQTQVFDGSSSGAQHDTVGGGQSRGVVTLVTHTHNSNQKNWASLRGGASKFMYLHEELFFVAKSSFLCYLIFCNLSKSMSGFTQWGNFMKILLPWWRNQKFHNIASF